MADFIDRVWNFISVKYYFIGKLAEIILIILVSMLITRIGKYIIKKFFEKRKLLKYGLNNKKVDTMASLSSSIFRYTVYLVAIIMILTDVFDLKSILAAAGIGGVAIGLGAQSLIKDVISGFFIVMEDQYAIGDLITVDSMTGTVEELGLRVTKLRNSNGDLHVIPNGEIKKMTNHTRGSKLAVADIPLSYDADIGKAMDIANAVCARVNKEFDTIIEPASVLGITELNKEGLNLRITAKTQPNEQGPVERRIRLLVIEEFHKNNIKLPHVINSCEDKRLKGDGDNG